MIETWRRKLGSAHRHAVRRRLAVFLEWLGYHAIAPYAGQTVTHSLMAKLTDEVELLLEDVAGSGAFRYFGMNGRAEMRSPPVEFSAQFDPDGRIRLTLDSAPLVRWMMLGGWRRSGWVSVDALSLTDL